MNEPLQPHTSRCAIHRDEKCNCRCTCDDPANVVESHPCPYTEEMGGGGADCKCCRYCTGQCAMDI